MERPKHAGEGVKYGLGAAFAGVGAGLASLVVLPAKGAKEGGVRGAAIGMGQGVAAFAGLSVLGVGAGVVQVVRGAAATPEAISARLQGKEYDRRTRRWIFYNLKEEAELVLNMNEAGFVKYIQSDGSAAMSPGGAEGGATGPWNCAACTLENPPEARSCSACDGPRPEGHSGKPTPSNDDKKKDASGKKVKDTELYDLLGVDPDASASQIKKAYFKKARECHPDKHPDDEKAKERFQAVSNAYQVLSDDSLRAKYDAGGKAGLDEQPKMDSKAFYEMMFGSEEFEPLVGRMNVLDMIGVEEEDDENAQPPEGLDEDSFRVARMELRRWKREVSCAMNLVDLLEPFVSGAATDDAFRSKLEALGTQLCSSAVGAALLGCIGSCYKQQATKQLGNAAVGGGVAERFSGAGAFADQKFKAFGNYVEVTKAGLAAASAAHAVEAEGTSEEAKAKAQQAAAQKTIQAMFAATTIEISGLLQKVIKKVTHDTSVEQPKRKARAQALLIAGEVFLKCSAASGGGAMEEAMQRLGAVAGSPGESSDSTGNGGYTAS